MVNYTFWVANIIIICEWHVKTGSHLKIQAILDQILAEGYKWDRIYDDVRKFWFKCQNWSVSSGKLRKGGNRSLHTKF